MTLHGHLREGLRPRPLEQDADRQAAFATATTRPDHDVSPGHLSKTLYDDSLSGSSHLLVEAFKGLFQHTGKRDVVCIQAIEPTQRDLDLAA